MRDMPHALDARLSPSSPQHDAADLVLLFNSAFGLTENTILVRNITFPFDGPDENATEPVYLPEDAECPRNRIVFAHGFFASALHEIAHWCVAGAGRRQFVDYGYWYQPDGRDAVAQKLFEQVELKPQAVEWAFSIAAGFPFDVSVDNVSGVGIDRKSFRKRVHGELKRFADNGFPARAQQFIEILHRQYNTEFRIPPGA